MCSLTFSENTLFDVDFEVKSSFGVLLTAATYEFGFNSVTIELSECFGKLASPEASGSGSEEWTQVCRVIPSSWLSLLDVKSQHYQAQINYKLAMVLLCLATSGRMPEAGPVEIGPLPADGLYSEDVFMEEEVGRKLMYLSEIGSLKELRCPQVDG
nr:hypothetical protein HmN_000205300 [Hymenolepis microstoma]